MVEAAMQIRVEYLALGHFRQSGGTRNGTSPLYSSIQKYVDINEVT